MDFEKEVERMYRELKEGKGRKFSVKEYESFLKRKKETTKGGVK